MTTTLDCRGLACPGPVLRCLECLKNESPAELAVLVDDSGALENVSRLLAGKGYTVSNARTGEHWTISACGGAAPAAQGEGDHQPVPGAACAAAVRTALGQTCVFLTREVIGGGDDELGGKLMLNFLGTLPELGDSLWRIVLVNGAVKLACEGHPCLEKLHALADAGVSILVCGTCLGFFGLMEKKQVGETTNMLDVVTSLNLAAKVIEI
jgi:selenium metabolism protein YedF